MVGRSCCVINCHSRSHDRRGKLGNGIRFFSFPTWKRNEGKLVEDVTLRRRTAWVAAVRRPDITFHKISASMRVCSLHFHSGQPAYEMLQSHPDWIPSLHLGHSDGKVTNMERFSSRSARDRRWREIEARTHREEEEEEEVVAAEEEEEEAMARREEEEEVAAAEEEEAIALREAGESGRERGEDAARGDEAVGECSVCERRRDEINRLLDENRRLKRELDKRKTTEQFLVDDDAKVEYYTGLPSFASFLALLTSVMAHLPQGRRVLTPFQTLLLTFMRLRLDLPVRHVAHLFRVDPKTAAVAFGDTICVLHTHLSPLLRWPDRKSLRAGMPGKFLKAFGDGVAVIVDCFEVFAEEPPNPQAPSDDKRLHSRKYLVGITPQGVISFVSKGWGGRASDRQVTECCGFLEKLSPGDTVLAHRGFDINDGAGMMCAEVKAPAFVKGGQLDTKDVEETREMAHVRVHVKRVVNGVCNRYKILAGTIPVSLVLLPCKGEDGTALDTVVTVCCALTNMSPNVV